MKKTARLPSSEAAKRIAAIFHRQLTTKWSEKEIKTFRALVKDGYFDVLNGLGLIERCYRMQWPPRRDNNILRHDLATFLNWYPTELDRATAWNELHPEKPKPRVIIPLPPTPSKPFVQTPEEKELTDRFMADYRARKGREPVPRTFADVKRIMEGQ